MTFRRLLNWTVGLPVAVLAIAFAVANRQWIVVSFDPFARDQPFAAIEMPLWLLFFCGILAGLVCGWVAAWFAQSKWRKAARQGRIELLRAQAEHEQLRRQVERQPAPAEDMMGRSGPP